MSRESLFIKLRQTIAKVPGARRWYESLRLLLAPSYNEDGLVTIHNADFLRDPQFVRAYEAALAMQPKTFLRWRAHVTQWAGYHAKNLAGDFVECGVNRAFLSTSVINYIDFRLLHPRKFFLFDTYCGLVRELITPDDRAAYRNHYADSYDFVQESFKDYENVVVVKGVVPDSLSTVAIDKVAYLSIDMNCVQPEVAALKYFWPRIVSGGVIILDDYGFSGHEAQKKGADKFASSKGVKILSLPTGQGLLVKPSDL